MPVVILCPPLIGDIHLLYLHTKVALEITVKEVTNKYQLKKIKLAHLTPPHKSCFMSYLEAHIIDVVKSCSQYQSPGTRQSHRPVANLRVVRSVQS